MPRMRSHQPSSTDECTRCPRRRRVGGWVVAAVLVLAVGVVGWVVAKPYLARARRRAAAAQLDPRAQAFVADGEKAMADGNLELAQEDFDKASALAENDPRVLLDEARVAAASADVPWLKLRLLPPDATDELRATKAQLADRSRAAARQPTTPLAAAPDDPAALAREGRRAPHRGRARRGAQLVAKIIAQASQPETAYVLAALDLAEAEPLWTTVIDRLRLAAAGEGNAGRARAALVYALARSGDVAGARAELGKLDALARPYPLLARSARVRRSALPRRADARRGAARRASPTSSVSALPTQPLPADGQRRRRRGGRPGRAVASAMQAAAKAIHKGDWSRARQIYEALVSRNPERLRGALRPRRRRPRPGRLRGRDQRVQARAGGQPVVPAGAARRRRHRVGQRRPRGRAADLQGHRRPLPGGHVSRRT